MNKTVIDLVRQSLIDAGYDGLYNEDAECGCLLDDLRPCGNDFAECNPGYKGASTEFDFTIYGSKDDAEASFKEVGK